MQLPEWAELTPSPTREGLVLAGLSFEGDQKARSHALELHRAGVVTVTERLDGLAIATRSFVGRIRIGPLDLTIVPKISWARWLRLVGYALRLRGLVRTDRVSVRLDPVSLHDLIVLELVAEAHDLLARGLHRDYVQRRGLLTAPRGRVDMARVARRGGIREPAIPCRYTRRSDDSPMNQALLAGLRFAALRTTDRNLRADTRRVAHQLEMTVTAPRLSYSVLELARSANDRRTKRYDASLRLIQLLLDGETAALEDDPEKPSVQLSGFALDMNRVWQQLLARVLREWSGEVNVREEFALRGVFHRNATYPFRRQMPTPRPDFAAFTQGRLIGFLDAKYRDLWELPLPREMLYQLALYAMAQRGGAAAILYPSHSRNALEQWLDMRDPLTGQVRASIALRPVPLEALESLIAAPATARRSEERSAFARSLVRAG